MISKRPGQSVTLECKAEANETVDKETRYKQILEVLEGRKMTAKEIAVEMYKCGYIPTTERNYTAPRLTEMSQAGLVEPAGKTKCIYTHRTVTVYKVRRG